MRDISGLSFDDFKKSSYFPSLDGLRAIAVILVLCVHYGGDQAARLTGWLGVEMFFVLSGFLITTLLLRENDNHGRISLTSFYIRRVFRILPAYYLVFAFVIWQSYRLGDAYWPQLKTAFPYYLTLMNEQSGVAPWKLTWTLGIEWKFYLVWPILAFVLARNTVSRVVLSVVIAALLIKFWLTAWLLPYYYLLLLGGSFLAIMMHSARGYRIVAPLTNRYVAPAMFIAFIVFQLNVYRVAAYLKNDAITADVYGLMVMLLVPAALAGGWHRRILASKPAVYIGERSYALYLIQIIASQAVSGFMPWHSMNFGYVLAVTIVGLMMAECVRKFVELPAIALGSQLSKKLRRYSARKSLPVNNISSVLIRRE